MFSCNKFFLFIINLRILSFSQVGFSLHPIQVLKCLDLPQPLPTYTTILLPIATGNKSASLEYFINIIFKTELHQIYHTHYQTKDSELTVPPWIIA